MVDHAGNLLNTTTAERPSAAGPCSVPESEIGGLPAAETETAPTTPLAAPTPSGPGPVNLDGCPTPLAWQEVLRIFREESQPWEVDRGAYRVRGRAWGNGPPLYFLNGMGGTHELYCLVAYLLRESFRCVFYDYPGTDGERAPLSRISLADLAEDLFAVADHHGEKRFSVHATSFGGLVALQALASRPERIERAVLQGCFARRELSWAERALIQLCRFIPIRLRQTPLRTVIQQQNHRPWFPPHDPSRFQFLLENTGGVPLAALVHRARLIRDSDLRPLLPQVSQSVLLITGEGEGLVSSRCRDELQAGLPHATPEMMHSAGHLPYLTHPHRLAKLIRPFLLEGALRT
jgi:pimeloyl-ACP methyl ester carboxylesterase